MAEGPDLSGLDAPRPLPPALRERLESALLAAAGTSTSGAPAELGPAGGEGGPDRSPADDPFALDAPRPLPGDVRERLESAMLAGTGTGLASEPDRPAVAPAPTPLHRRPWVRPLLAAAAVLTLLLGSLAVLDLGDPGAGPGDRDVTAAGPDATTVPPSSTGPVVGIPSPTTAPPAEPPAPPTSRPSPPGRASSPSTEPPPPAPAAVPDGEKPPGGGATGGDEAAPAPAPEDAGSPSPGPDADPGPAPPFSSPSSPAPATSADQEEAPAASASPGSGAPGSGSAAPPPASPSSPRAAAPAGPPLRVGIFGGDAAQEAGFRAYVDLLNREGGVRGRPVELVPVGPGAPDSSTLVTVNLSPRPLVNPDGPPAWVTGPLLETLTATEDLLPAGGRVFSFASVPERQAHLAVDAVFPEAAPGASAVVYAATDGPYAGPVAAAFREVLSERGVAVTTVTYDPEAPPALLPAGAAFVSLDPPAAAAFARQAADQGYRPARGIAGVASLFDPALLADLPDGARVVSPYQVPGGAEGDAIQAGAGHPSAGVLHGWANAKVLAVALWRSGADTPGATLSALEDMAGYDSGLAPPYETRPRTRSRTPEGVVFEVRAGAFVADGAFRRDPH